jgi:hypothetical protein
MKVADRVKSSFARTIVRETKTRGELLTQGMASGPELSVESVKLLLDG